MSEAIGVIRDLQKQASGLCAECLRDSIAENTAVLDDLTGIAENMSSVRYASFENEELYQTAVAEVIAAAAIIAVFTAELTTRPAPVALPAFSNN
jgi:hypothetical protein